MRHRAATCGHCVTFLSVLLLLPISSHATVDWDDGFEYANGAAYVKNWPGKCDAATIDGGSIFQLTTTRAHSGSKSLKLNFVGHADQGCYQDRKLSSTSSVLYARWWMYMENFKVDDTSTKITRHDLMYTQADVWWAMFWGKPQLTGALQQTTTAKNYYGASIPQNQWVCVETYFNQGTPGSSNGVLQAWINGKQVINQTGLPMIPSGSSPSSQSYVRMYRQNGTGSIYYDDYAVSRDARIGCNTAPSASIPPPGNLTVQ